MLLRRTWTTALLAFFLAAQYIPTTFAASRPPPFPDMQQSWYRYQEAVEYLKNREIIGGYPDGTFQPKKTINRAELLKIVLQGKGDISKPLRRCFRDVHPDAWFAPYVCAAKERGIVQGYPNGTFQPDAQVNFAEAIKIMLSTYGHTVTEGSGEHWYEPYVTELERLEILPRHAYVPWTKLNRERAADVIWRLARHEEDGFLPRLSPGCGKSPISSTSTITVDGQQREFLLTVPAQYVPHDPVPLMIAFHGRTNSNAQVRQYMRLDREVRDSIIAYPAGIKNTSGSFTWGSPGDKLSYLRDTAFFDALVEHLANMYCIDMDRISVVGHSLGGGFANYIACVRGDIVLASATVGADALITPCAGPAAAMIVHNPKDNLSSFTSAERIRKLRVETNGCAMETESTSITALNCVQHLSCAGGNVVLWCPHTIDGDHRGEYYPHVWPSETARYIAEFLKSLR